MKNKESKKCSRCKETKPLSDFYNNRSKSDGKVTYCKECSKNLNKSINDRIKTREVGLKKDGTPDKRFLRRKDGYELPYGQRPQRKVWYEKNKDKLKTYSKQYRSEKRIEIQKKKKEYLNSIRLEGINEYGGKCVCCGEIIPEFLTIDHINGRLSDEKKHGGRNIKGKKLFLHLKSLGWPKDNYQLLCWNCNCAKGLYGECPHQKGGGQ